MRQDLSDSDRYHQMQGLSIEEGLSEGLIDVDDLIPNYSSFERSNFDDFDEEEVDETKESEIEIALDKIPF